MKLKKFLELNEMSLPNVNSAEQARAIVDKYYPLIMKGNPNGDYIGYLDAALKAFQGATNPEAYANDVKKALAAKKKVEAFLATKSKRDTPSATF